MLPHEIRQIARGRPERSGWFRAACYNPKTLCGVVVIFKWEAIVPDDRPRGLRQSANHDSKSDQDRDGPFFLFNHSDDIGVMGLCQCIDFDTLLKSQLTSALNMAKKHMEECHDDLDPPSHCRAIWEMVLQSIIDPGHRPGKRKDEEDVEGSSSFIEASQDVFRELWGVSRSEFPTASRTRTDPTFIPRDEFARVLSQAPYPDDSTMAEYYLKSRTTMLEGLLSMALVSSDIRMDRKSKERNMDWDSDDYD
ncbi:Alternative oxidase, mitochondrial precursor [Pestalotiopsis sp. IQ-011]